MYQLAAESANPYSCLLLVFPNSEDTIKSMELSTLLIYVQTEKRHDVPFPLNFHSAAFRHLSGVDTVSGQTGRHFFRADTWGFFCLMTNRADSAGTAHDRKSVLIHSFLFQLFQQLPGHFRMAFLQFLHLLSSMKSLTCVRV